MKKEDKQEGPRRHHGTMAVCLSDPRVWPWDLRDDVSQTLRDSVGARFPPRPPLGAGESR